MPQSLAQIAFRVASGGFFPNGARDLFPGTRVIAVQKQVAEQFLDLYPVQTTQNSLAMPHREFTEKGNAQLSYGFI